MNPVAQKNQEEQHQCEHKQKASRLRGGGAGKVRYSHVVLQLSINATATQDCFLGMIGCFLCLGESSMRMNCSLFH